MTFAGLNYLAIFIAAVAGWITGAVWYRILGKPWLAALGRTQDDITMKRGTPAFYAPFVIAFIANLIIAWVLAGLIGHLGAGQVTPKNGVISGAFVWLGFVVTTMSVNNAFSGRKIVLTVIDSGHWLAVLIISSAIIGLMGVQ